MYEYKSNTGVSVHLLLNSLFAYSLWKSRHTSAAAKMHDSTLDLPVSDGVDDRVSHGIDNEQIN